MNTELERKVAELDAKLAVINHKLGYLDALEDALNIIRNDTPLYNDSAETYRSRIMIMVYALKGKVPA